ncbi:MAG TPA: RNA 2',3'-cyclic phosphodiesterase [Solirubrobacterales bacterium]|nr:RNA 2',3'-cyclic phosphodiesterase [Solirubrobacterales bacterium]
MAEGQEKSERVRLFVALDLPRDLRERIGEWGRQALADPALRPVSVENLHITLAFLGSRPQQQVEAITGVVEGGSGEAPLVALGNPEPRPRRRPKVFGLPATSPGAEALQASLVGRLAEAGLHEPEERPFWPHVTVARVRSESGRSRRPRPVEQSPEKLPEKLAEAWFCRRLTLYRSELQPSGARYVPLAQVKLPETGRQ